MSNKGNFRWPVLSASMPPPTGQVYAAMRTPLEPTLYRLAMEHASRAGDSEGKDLEHSLQAIILSAACLEAFINSVGMSVYGDNWQSYENGNLPDQARRPSLERKWMEVTEKHTDGNRFDPGKQPFQRLKDLVQLRDYILHYKAPFAPPVPSTEGNITEARARINHESAGRATRAMKAMLLEFHRLAKAPIPDWVT